MNIIFLPLAPQVPWEQPVLEKSLCVAGHEPVVGRASLLLVLYLSWHIWVYFSAGTVAGIATRLAPGRDVARGWPFQEAHRTSYCFSYSLLLHRGSPWPLTPGWRPSHSPHAPVLSFKGPPGAGKLSQFVAKVSRSILFWLLLSWWVANCVPGLGSCVFGNTCIYKSKLTQ